MTFAVCPNCDAKVLLGARPRLGNLVDCLECNTELELVWLNPPELDWPWQYEDDDTMVYEDLGADY